MKEYFKCIFLILIVIFSFYYTNKVLEFSQTNNSILTSINNYANKNNTKCIEGSISNEGIVLGLSGVVVDKNKSYSNMKGTVFNKNLIEYKKDKCILNRENNYDKYIISGNKIKNNISLVIDIVNNKYYSKMIDIFKRNNVKYNLLVNDKYNSNYINILYKGNNIKSFRKKHKDIFCVKNNNYEIINDCKKYNINSIRIVNYVDSNLLYNIKKLLNNGSIIFIKESNLNLNELDITIKYIISRGYNIVSVNELLF